MLYIYMLYIYICVCVSVFLSYACAFPMRNSSRMQCASVRPARRAPDFVPMQCMGMTSVPQSQSWQDLPSTVSQCLLTHLWQGSVFQPGGNSYDFLRLLMTLIGSTWVATATLCPCLRVCQSVDIGFPVSQKWLKISFPEPM